MKYLALGYLAFLAVGVFIYRIGDGEHPLVEAFGFMVLELLCTYLAALAMRTLGII